MKLSRISWTVLIVGIFIISFAGLGAAHSQQLEEQKQLNEELSLAEIRLSKFQIDQLSSQREELGKQLNQAALQLEVAKDDLRQRIESIGVTDYFFYIAEDCGVEIIEISSSGLSSDELEVAMVNPSYSDSDDLEEITCSMQVLTAEVEGDVADLITFIISLNSNFTTGVVVSAEIDIPAATEEEVAEEEEEEEVEVEEEEEEEEEEVEVEEEEVVEVGVEVEEEEEEVVEVGVEVEVKKPSANIRMIIYAYEGD